MSVENHVTPEIVEVPVEETVPETQESKILDIFKIVSSLEESLKTLKKELKELKGDYTKELKSNKKRFKKKKNVRKASGSTMNGFLKQTKMSDGLCEFLGVKSGSEITRPEVTKIISKYISDNNLATKENKTIFSPDNKLTKLLGPKKFLLSKKDPSKGNGYTYFNLQSYLKDQGHFLA
jgi:chromatin remodeling complex protein RSC6